MDILVLNNSTKGMFSAVTLFVLTKKDNADSYFFILRKPIFIRLRKVGFVDFTLSKH